MNDHGLMMIIQHSPAAWCECGNNSETKFTFMPEEMLSGSFKIIEKKNGMIRWW